MKRRDNFESNDADFDRLDAKIHQALKEEGAIIPTNVEDVCRAKARLKARPVTVPPHLRDSAAIIKQIAGEESSEVAVRQPATVSRSAESDGGLENVPHRKGSMFYRRAAFDAYVVHALADDENLGRTKIEKITHLTEYHCRIDFEREPLRDAAGPVDYPSRRKVESLGRKQGWYFTVAAGNHLGEKYVAGPNILKALPVAKRTLGGPKAAVDALLELMRPLDTKCCEILATLYAAWNDLLLQGNSPTDEVIVKEATEKWHPSKPKIPFDRWIRALAWMRNNRLVPQGTGKPALPTS